MAGQSLEEKLQRAFADEATGKFADTYYQRIIDAWSKHRDQAKRNAILIIVMVAAYELLARSTITKASLGPFEVTDLSLIQRVLPVLLAYTGFQLQMILVDEEAIARLFYAATRVLYKPLYNEDLELYLRPPGIPLFAVETILQPRKPILARLLRQTKYLGMATVFAPTVFTIYTIVRNFAEFGFRDLLVWISTLISMYLLLYGAALLIHGIALVRED